ncbi:MAG: CotH kinase family protein [Treponema sp.]|jgi:hypothetical protein|nr:CotH kinase family protein [Treponema sp.]
MKKNGLLLAILGVTLALGMAVVGCDTGLKTQGKAIEKIIIETPPLKVNYLMGEAFDLSGLSVTVIYTDGSEEPTAAYTIQGDTFTAGTRSIAVSLSDKTATFDVVVENTLVDTGLPVVYIETQNRQHINSKETYITANMIIKDHNNIVHENTMRIRGRGNATWTYPKKPYKIKLDSKANFFSMGNDKDWVLLANYCDKSLMRTGLAFEMSKILNFAWTPDAEFVELVLNGEYQGNYQLVEGIKQDTKRVNIPSDGFIVERDGYYLQEPKYFVTNEGFGYSFKNPDTDDLTNDQWDYIKNYLNGFETVLYSDGFNDPDDGYQKYIDIDSFAGWFLLQNIIANMDTNPYLTKSDFTPSSKVFMGPPWDFEWSNGIGWYDGPRPRPANYWVCNGWYYEKLLTDTAFVNKLKELWSTYRSPINQAALQYIDNTKVKLTQSQKLNFRRWDILNTRVSVEGIPLGSFDAEVGCDRQFFVNHMAWLDTAINGL